ncbi:unnamed protein product [Ilex paraguariensis]|uniref:Molybdate-anion transporter n=1 Tax=Ilex paraguariensis TaxID=185542 RepID=A0ABC8TEW9_9AQUA
MVHSLPIIETLLCELLTRIGPYFYYLYATYGFGKGEIGQLFIAGFGSSMLFGTIVGSVAEIQGQKQACVTYCITYILSCITKHSPQYKVLILGCVLGDVGIERGAFLVVTTPPKESSAEQKAPDHDSFEKALVPKPTKEISPSKSPPTLESNLSLSLSPSLSSV